MRRHPQTPPFCSAHSFAFVCARTARGRAHHGRAAQKDSSGGAGAVERARLYAVCGTGCGGLRRRLWQASCGRRVVAGELWQASCGAGCGSGVVAW
eukprot:4196220-Prymnesium_polylepis.1